MSPASDEGTAKWNAEHLEELRETLILFNERVDRLDETELAQKLEDTTFRIDTKRMMNSWISIVGISKDAVDAFVLNIRLLTQDRDGISIRELAEDVYTDANSSIVPVELREKFTQARQRWNDYRAVTSIPHPTEEARNFTNGELYEIFLYGGLAHSNRNKVRMFRQVTPQGPEGTFAFGHLLRSLRVLLEVVRSIRDINSALLTKIPP